MIKRNFLWSFALSLLILFSGCHRNESKKEQEPEKVEAKTLEVVYNPGNIINHTSAEGASYSIYVPANYSTEKKYSIIIFLDPHGKGNLPLKKYKGLADKFGVFLLGSNDSKNGIGMEEGVNIIQRLMNECKTFPFFDGNVSLCGFSGGAKLALVGGNSVTKFNSIIYCGAALPPQSINLNTALIGYAGKKDMNYTEVKNFSRWAGTQIPVNGIVEWPGKHEWPDSAAFQRAFYWHGLNAPVDKNNPLINAYISFIDNLVAKEKNPLRQVEMLTNKSCLLEKYIPVNEFKKQIGKIILTSEYNNAKAKEVTTITNEDNQKQELMSAFSTQDLNWWSARIKKLSADKENESNQRLLGYISLASWSYSSKAVEENDIPFALKTLQIYQLADPENSEHEFLKACLYAKNNNADSAVYFLNEAVKLGMDDRSRIENEKNLASLRGRNDFQSVLSTIKYDN